MKRLWLAYQQLIDNRTHSEIRGAEQDLQFWKDRLFVNFIMYFISASTIALVPAVFLTLRDGYYFTCFVDISTFLLLIAIPCSKRLSFKVKKQAIVAIIYLLSIYLIAAMSYPGGGELYLLVTPIIAALFLPVRLAYRSVATNTLTVLLFAVIIQYKLFNIPLLLHYTLATWLNENCSVLFLSFVVVAMIDYIFKSLQSTISSNIQIKQDYKTIFDNSPLPMFLFDTETFRFENINEAAIRHYGYSREEFLSMTLLDIRPEEDKAESLKRLQHNTQTGELYHGLSRHVNKSGEIIMVRIETNTINYGNKLARLVLATDVTEQFRAAKEIEKVNERLKTAQQIGKIGYWQYDCSTETTYWSDMVYQMFNVEGETFELTLANIRKYIHPRDWQAFVNVFTPDDKAKTRNEIEYQVVCPHLPVTYIYQIANYIYDDSGKLTRIEGVVQNITERKAAELKVKESELNLRSIFENTTAGFVLIDDKFEIKAFNSKAQELTLINNGGKSYIMGRNMLEFIEPGRLEPFSQILEQVFNGQLVEYDMAYPRENGLTQWIHYTFTPVYVGNDVLGACLAGRDITVLRNYLYTIEEQNKAFHEISWMQSHLVRAPLANVMSLTALLEIDLTEAEKKEIIRHLKTSSNKLDNIISQITELTVQTSDIFTLDDKF